MALIAFMETIANEFSGKEFTTEQLVNFVTNSNGNSNVGVPEEPKKVKKVKKAPKKIKMTIRQYFMTQETDVYKAKVTSRVEEHKQFNLDNKDSIEEGDVEAKPENFLKVMKSVMDELSESDINELKEKVEKYIKDQSESDSE